jgi:ankyrin repeat protein
VAAGADTDAQDSSGSTPLHAAAKRGDYAVCAALVGAGCDVDRVDAEGSTPLCKASTVQVMVQLLAGGG